MSKEQSNSAATKTTNSELSRRDLLRGGAALIGASVIGSGVSNVLANETETKSIEAISSSQTRPNILYFLVDNLGYGELGCYGGGILRGPTRVASTTLQRKE